MAKPPLDLGIAAAALVVVGLSYVVFRSVQVWPAGQFNNLGIALQQQGRTDEAMAEFRRAIALDPQFGAAHNNLGTALQTLGKTDEAMAEFRRAIALDPQFGAAHNNLGAALQTQGKTDEAIAEFLVPPSHSTRDTLELRESRLRANWQHAKP